MAVASAGMCSANKRTARCLRRLPQTRADAIFLWELTEREVECPPAPNKFPREHDDRSSLLISIFHRWRINVYPCDLIEDSSSCVRIISKLESQREKEVRFDPQEERRRRNQSFPPWFRICTEKTARLEVFSFSFV